MNLNEANDEHAIFEQDRLRLVMGSDGLAGVMGEEAEWFGHAEV